MQTARSIPEINAEIRQVRRDLHAQMKERDGAARKPSDTDIEARARDASVQSLREYLNNLLDERQEARNEARRIWR